MSVECELLSKCGYFKKYQETKNAVCLGFIATFCKGTKMEACKRKEYRKKNNAPPPDDMLPSGQLVVS